MTINPNIKLLEMKTKLSTLWIVALFNNTFRDFHEFLRADFLDWMLETTSNGAAGVSPTLLLGSALFYQIPIGMIFLTQVLNVKVNRWANLIAAPIFFVGAISGIYFSSFTPDIDDFVFFGVVGAAMLAIIWYAWRWKKQEA